MSNTPQPIAVHSGMAFQNFRKGECGPYKNPVLYSAPNFAFTNIVIRRAVTGASATVTLVDLDDNDVTTLTPTSAVSWPLDSEGEMEMLVLGTGSWAGAASVMTDTYYYLRIESGVFEYYTDEFYAMPADSGFPENCGENVWAKLTYTLNGTKIVSGTTTANPAIPVYGFAQTTLSFFVFLNASLSQPEWAQDETGEEDAHGQVVVDRMSLAKRWRLEGIPVSEAIVDTLTVSALSDLAFINFSDGNSVSPIKRIITQPTWREGGCNADVKYNFETIYFVKQGC